MKSLATKLVVMVLVTIALSVIASGVSFVTNDPMLGYFKSVVIDSIVGTTNYASVVKHHN